MSPLRGSRILMSHAYPTAHAVGYVMSPLRGSRPLKLRLSLYLSHLSSIVRIASGSTGLPM
jgi:hypothetical protein